MFKKFRFWHTGGGRLKRSVNRLPRSGRQSADGARDPCTATASLFDEAIVRGLVHVDSLQQDAESLLHTYRLDPSCGPPRVATLPIAIPHLRHVVMEDLVLRCSSAPPGQRSSSPSSFFFFRRAAGPRCGPFGIFDTAAPVSPWAAPLPAPEDETTETSGESSASHQGSLLLDSFLLSHLPAPVSLFSMAGHVVHQNQASKEYMGDAEALRGQGCPSPLDTLTGVGGVSASSLRRGLVAAALQPEGGQAPPSDLQRLFSMDPTMLLDLQKVVLTGKVWTGTVRLPAHGQRLLCERSSKSRLKVLVGGKSVDSGGGLVCARGGSGGWDKGWDAELGAPGLPPRPSSPQPARPSSPLSCACADPAKAMHHGGPPQRRLVATLSQRSRPSPQDMKLGRFSPSRHSSLLGANHSSLLGSISLATASCGGGGGTGASSQRAVWHEVVAKVVRDPVAGRDLILLTQTDVTTKVTAEQRSEALLEAEHAVLELLFPRHIIEHIVGGAAAGGGKSHRQSSGGESSGSMSGLLPARRRSSVGWAPGEPLSPSWLATPVRKTVSCTIHQHLLSPPPTPTPPAVPCSTSHEEVTIMFADIVGFTSMCKCVPPATVMAFLNELYSALDELLGIFNVYKVETAGDCYIVAGGLMRKDADGYTSVRTDVDPKHALTVLEFAKAMLRESRKVLNPVTGEPIQMRIGMHSGPVVSGVVGTKMPRFCLFGDSMNTAQRMESKSRPGAIHVSEATQKLLPNEPWLPTGGVELKGLGVRPSYFWSPPRPTGPRAPTSGGGGGGGCCSSESLPDSRAGQPPQSRRGGACSQMHDLHVSA